MCGIWGTVAFDGAPAPVALVSAGIETLRHRGPDDEAVLALGSAAFGQTRLAIVGPNADEAAQPSTNGRHLLTFNGEIYNFRELVDRLSVLGVRVSGKSDTEVLFTALALWGVEATLPLLDGMFAFAWYDHETGKLSLCRDPLGEKFIYWGMSRHRVSFGSEIKAVLETNTVPKEPNLDRIDDYFFTGKINGRATFFRNIHEVEPGTWVEIDTRKGFATNRKHWSLTENIGSSNSFVASEFGSAFRTAVSSRRLADVPIGVLLSGGIDSNALTRTLVEEDPSEVLHLYFADNRDPAMSENSAADAFVSRLKTDFPDTDIRFNKNLLQFDDYNTRMKRLTWHYDEPLQFMNSPLLGGLCDLARADGLKVLLSGEGSDEILFGYDRFSRTTAMLGPDPAKADILRHLYFGGGIDKVNTVRALCGQAGEGAEATEAWHWLEAECDQFGVNRLQLLFSQRYRLQTLLQRQDRIGMASGIEIRVPFLRPSLVSAMNSVSIEALYDAKQNITKLPLRAAMRGKLPELILNKKKDGFPSDMHVWLREPRMLELLSGMIQQDDSFSSLYLSRDRIDALLSDHFSGQQHFDVLVWLLFSLETWHDVFFRDTHRQS